MSSLIILPRDIIKEILLWCQPHDILAMCSSTSFIYELWHDDDFGVTMSTDSKLNFMGIVLLMNLKCKATTTLGKNFLKITYILVKLSQLRLVVF
jgi:hypothetical protein